MELIRIGSHADDGRLYGSKKPAVHLNVTLADLEARRRTGIEPYVTALEQGAGGGGANEACRSGDKNGHGRRLAALIATGYT